MALITTEYGRSSAVSYAHRWANARNPAYYNYELIGGDCTNFVSQCVLAGAKVMNYDKNGWYYIDANNKSPSWTGVPFFRDFLVRSDEGPGPAAREASVRDMMPGDVIQLLFEGKTFQHSTLVVQTGAIPDENNIHVAAHTDNGDYLPLKSYDYKKIRYLHITGVYRWAKGF